MAGRAGEIPDLNDVPAANAARAVLQQAHLDVSNILPRTITKVLTRAACDFFLTVARRPADGTRTRLEEITTADLVKFVKGGRITPTEALEDVLRRSAIAGTTAAVLAQLNAVGGLLAQLMKSPGFNVPNAITSSSGELLGAFTLAYAQAGRVVSFDSATTVIAGAIGSLGEGIEEQSRVLQAKIIRPKSMGQFSHMLLTWCMICAATTLASILVTGAFIKRSVHESMENYGLSWQIAHELFLVLIEAVESQTAMAGGGIRLGLGNIFEAGGMDSFRERATQRARTHFPSISGGGFRERETSAWNGKSTASNDVCCGAFNTGRPHTPEMLLPDGTCKFAHRCNKFVSKQPDGTAGGQCGSTQHGRCNCTNPFKSERKVN